MGIEPISFRINAVLFEKQCIFCVAVSLQKGVELLLRVVFPAVRNLGIWSQGSDAAARRSIFSKRAARVRTISSQSRRSITRCQTKTPNSPRLSTSLSRGRGLISKGRAELMFLSENRLKSPKNRLKIRWIVV